MDDIGPFIGMNRKFAQLQHKIDEALRLLKMDNPDIELVIEILEGKENASKSTT